MRNEIPDNVYEAIWSVYNALSFIEESSTNLDPRVAAVIALSRSMLRSLL